MMRGRARSCDIRLAPTGFCSAGPPEGGTEAGEDYQTGPGGLTVRIRAPGALWDRRSGRGSRGRSGQRIDGRRSDGDGVEHDPYGLDARRPHQVHDLYDPAVSAPVLGREEDGLVAPVLQDLVQTESERLRIHLFLVEVEAVPRGERHDELVGRRLRRIHLGFG